MTLNEFIERATAFFQKAEAKESATDKELAEAKRLLAASTTQNTTLEAQLAEAAKKITDLEAALTAKTSEATKLTEDLKAAGNKVDTTLAAMGVDPKTIPAAPPAAGKPQGEELLTKWNAITDPYARRDFYLKHKDELSAIYKKSHNTPR